MFNFGLQALYLGGVVESAVTIFLLMVGGRNDFGDFGRRGPPRGVR
jgi:hypothetical protein